MSNFAALKNACKVSGSLTGEQITNRDLQTNRAIHAERRSGAKEDVVWLPVDSTNSGIQIVAAVGRH